MKYALPLVLMLAASPVSAEGLPDFVTAKARAACEKDVRRVCVKGGEKVTYQHLKSCISKNFKKMNNDCQYEIVSLLPEIEKYEQRKARK